MAIIAPMGNATYSDGKSEAVTFVSASAPPPAHRDERERNQHDHQHDINHRHGNIGAEDSGERRERQ
jgi:hypothetical protein